MTVVVMMMSNDADMDRRDSLLADVVGEIGSDGFGPALESYLQNLCGADLFAGFQLAPNDLQQVVTDRSSTSRERFGTYVAREWWRQDPAIKEAKKCLVTAATGLIHIDFSDRWYSELRRRLYMEVRDRVVLCGHHQGAFFGLTVLKTGGSEPFDDREISRLGESAEHLVAIVAKHAALVRGSPNLAAALTCVADIEACIQSDGALPPREAQVCARILRGLSSIGIALDLHVSEETVKTYRKRAYQRLGIGSERELLNWYLRRWSRWQFSAGSCPWEH